LERSDFLRIVIEKGMKEMSIELAIKKLKNGELSLWRVAELAGLSLWEFIEELRKRRIVIYSEEDLKEDLRIVESVSNASDNVSF